MPAPFLRTVPAVLPNVNVLDACPLLLVVAMAGLRLPVEGEVIAKVTLVPCTTFAPASLTVTTNGFARAALIEPL